MLCLDDLADTSRLAALKNINVQLVGHAEISLLTFLEHICKLGFTVLIAVV